MARGKYATRAANVRAETAQETVAELRQQLAEERAARAVETAALKTQVQQLSGKLTSSVNDIAAHAIAEAKQEALGKIHQVEAAAEARGIAVLKILSDRHAKLSSEAWQEVYAALGIHPADDKAGVLALGGEKVSRETRRVGRKTFMGDVKRADAIRDRESLSAAMAKKLGAEEETGKQGDA